MGTVMAHRFVGPLAVEDLRECLPLWAAFCEESACLGPLNEQVVLANWEALLKSDTGALWGAWSDGELIGLIGMAFDAGFFTGIPRAQELCWYVKPAHRHGRDGIKLLWQAEAWAVRKGAKQIIFGRYLTEAMEALDGVYQRLGYRPFGMGYQKNV